MTLLRRSWGSMAAFGRRVGPEFTKFSIIGVMNMLLDLGLWNLLIETAMADAEVKAKILSSLIAATSAFFMNRHWAFKHRSRSAVHREYMLFFFFNGVGLVIQTGAVFIAKYGMSVSSHLVLNVAGMVGIVLAAVFRFWSYRAFVWTHPPQESASAETQTATTTPLPTKQPVTAPAPAGR